jgi:hypothetical protein
VFIDRKRVVSRHLRHSLIVYKFIDISDVEPNVVYDVTVDVVSDVVFYAVLAHIHYI